MKFFKIEFFEEDFKSYDLDYVCNRIVGLLMFVQKFKVESILEEVDFELGRFGGRKYNIFYKNVSFFKKVKILSDLEDFEFEE